jgi:DNA polymerase-1
VATDLGGEFWDEFKGVKKWQQEEVAFYNKHLYVQTLGGFKRRGIMSLNELINLPIQGTAAEIVQAAHIALSELAELNDDPELQPRINVHDDLTFSISDETLEQKIEVIAREMCKVRFDYINVPLIVEASVGARWDQTEEYKVFRSDVLFGTKNPYAKEQA